MVDVSPVVLTVILTSLLILLLLAGITISFFEINRHKEKQKTLLVEAALKYQKELRAIEIELGEELRSQMARELHDHLGHEITCLRLAFENHKLDYPDMAELFEALNENVTRASSQIRLLSRTLNKDYIGELPLNEAIGLEVQRQHKLGVLKIEWDHNYEQGLLAKDQELIIFRIFQEILNNALKHSKANDLKISLYCKPSFLMSIKDNGIGFNLNHILSSNKASGLLNIKKRAEMAGMECQIFAAENEGCEYQLKMKTHFQD